LIVFLAAALPFASADDMLVPNYTNPRERIPAPDLTPYGRIRFVTTVDFPPFSFLDQTGHLAGFHVDLARAICDELDVLPRCQIQALPWGELEGALENGQAEALISGLAITAESREKFRFTRPYLALPARFAAKKDGSSPQGSAKALAGKRVGVLGGTAHEAMLRDWFSDLQPVTFSRSEWMFEALKDNTIDAVFGDGLQLSFWLSSQSAESCCRFLDGPYFSQAHLGEGLAIAVQPRKAPLSQAPLSQAFDHALSALNRNGRFTELYLRWFPNGLY
jgi:polar amino acid transport system substrate-binding protein